MCCHPHTARPVNVWNKSADFTDFTISTFIRSRRRETQRLQGRCSIRGQHLSASLSNHHPHANQPKGSSRWIGLVMQTEARWTAYQLLLTSYHDNKETGKKDSEDVQVLGSSSLTPVSPLGRIHTNHACMHLAPEPANIYPLRCVCVDTHAGVCMATHTGIAIAPWIFKDGRQNT